MFILAEEKKSIDLVLKISQRYIKLLSEYVQKFQTMIKI
jgi:hypothetical protein